MDELTAVERRLVAGLEAYTGPRRRVDALGIARAAARQATTRPERLPALAAIRGWLDAGRYRSAFAVLAVVLLVGAMFVGGAAVASLEMRPEPPVPVASPSPGSSSAPSPRPSPTPTAAPSTTPASTAAPASRHVTDIYTVHSDGTGLRRLTSDGVSSQPEWTSDGRIRFWDRGQFRVMNADGTDLGQAFRLGIPAFLGSTGWPSSGAAVQPTP